MSEMSDNVVAGIMLTAIVILAIYIVSERIRDAVLRSRLVERLDVEDNKPPQTAELTALIANQKELEELRGRVTKLELAVGGPREVKRAPTRTWSQTRAMLEKESEQAG